MNLLDFNHDVEFHSFYWDNFNQDILRAHQKVMQHFGIPIQYTQENIPHGEWLDHVIGNSKAKVVAIIEPDLIPLNREIIQTAIDYAYQNDSFIGCAQVSNHIYPATHIFASPAFFFISASCYEKLGRPSFMPTKRADVAEELSYLAEKQGIRYRTLFPRHFEREPVEGIWPLASYGFYGIGTVFEDSVYHLFQSRLAQNVELFLQRSQQVIDGTFSSSNFISATGFSQLGRIVKPPQNKTKKWWPRF